MDAVSERMSQVSAEMANHPGGKAHNKWNQSKRIVLVYRRNTEELLALIDRVKSDINLALELVQNVHEPVVADEFALQFDQRFFNMSASLAAAIDYLRTLTDQYSDTSIESEYQQRDTSIESEYQQRNDRLKDSPLGSFMRRFRNYLLHCGLPAISSSFNFQGAKGESPGEWTSDLYFSAESLLAWNGWTVQAKQYILDNGPEIDIGQAVRNYAKEVATIHDWLFGKFEELHGADIASFNELIDEYNRLLTGEADTGGHGHGFSAAE